ncbi:MAG: hypothetical protein QG589_424 [Patescibacteria group bacterium]|nr:hypothetical protein [Patescibacteria group bacterium]
MMKVEQVTKDGVVVKAIDQIFTPQEIYLLLKNMGFEVDSRNNPFKVHLDGKEYMLHIKNVTYLGNPHPLFKKRIQIPKKWLTSLSARNSFLLGVYKHDDNVIFIHFDKSKYLKRAMNNSSAHVSTIDLAHAVEEGVFRKTDSGGNIITVFSRDRFMDIFGLISNNTHVDLVSTEVSLFQKFLGQLKTEWYGIASYKEMLEAKFPDALQPEWPGFYLEFNFQKFSLGNHEYKNIFKYIKNKKTGQIDLDLDFSGRYFGDLKMHSKTSGVIMGNEKTTMNEALKKYGKIWYVVFHHTTERDKDHGGRTTQFWNQTLIDIGKKDKSRTLSYLNRMKYSINLVMMDILEINQFNKPYLQTLKQGMNSNQRARKDKYAIHNKHINNFLVSRSIVKI